jgi:hypothetical protein
MDMAVTIKDSKCSCLRLRSYASKIQKGSHGKRAGASLYMWNDDVKQDMMIQIG